MKSKSSKMGLFGKKLTVTDCDAALSYCRVSSKKQELEGSGLDSQATRNENLARFHNLKIDETFPDTFSGGGDFMKRPAMRELIAYLDSHPHKKYVVIFDDLKRFARDTKFHFELRAALSARNAVPLCSNFVFDDTPEGTFVETIQAAHNQLEREQNRRQVIEKQKACLERGYWAFHSLYGYKKDGKGSSKRDIPNEQNKYIKELFEGFFSGRFIQFIDGARFLKDVGMFGKADPEKYITSVKSILMQVFYAGYIDYPDWEVSRRLGIHEPTVSIELFESVQRKISRNFNATKVREDINPSFPLRGLVNCNLCGGKFTGAWSKGKNNLYPYYFCQKKECPLKGKTIRKKDLEDQYDELLKKMTTESDIIELAKAVFIDAKEKDEKDRIVEGKANDGRKQECEDEIDTYAKLAAKAKSEAVVAQYEKKIERLAVELEQIEADSIAEYDYGVPYRTALDKVLGVLEKPYPTWVELNVFEQQKFFSFLFETNLVYDKNEGYRTPKYTVLKRVCEGIEHGGSVNVEMARIELASELGCGCESTVCILFLGFKVICLRTNKTQMTRVV
jgi:site-specific DNA recombinase